ncbi:hypothetical protein NPX13_g8809 [Xylaria arbuscula]|uniref:GRIP domain-containing protein n=1 Tax=Xylaria arbuscula TaxID=114810 RepID=A0A9W8TJH0_9PEZI|nr:hypothetical protein NPX13_g8809 [Xylaria arbuscula]
MFAKFKELRDGLERTMAEEQARLKASAEQKPDKNKNAPASLEGAPPAEFEKVFKDALDTPEESTASSSPSDGSKPAASGSEAKPSDDDSHLKSKDAGPSNVGENNKTTAARTPETTTDSKLPPDVIKRLRKLDKIESQYTSLMRSYKIAHTRVSFIDDFEKALREHTQCSSIRDTEDFVQYVKTTKEKIDLSNEERRRISEEKQTLNEKHKELEEKLPKLEAQLVLRDEEVAKLTADIDELKDKHSKQLEDLNSKLEHNLAEFQKSNEEKDAELKNLRTKYDQKEAELTAEKAKHEAVVKKYEETANMQRVQPSAPITPKPSIPSTAPASKKGGKKNKKNQKKGGASQLPTDLQPTEPLEPSQPSNGETDAEALRAENVKLKEDIASKDVQIEQLTKKRESVLEDKALLEGELSEIAALEARISELEEELADSIKAKEEAESKKQADSELEHKAKLDEKQKEIDELKVQLQATNSELGAAQKLAQERFDNLTRLKDSTARIQADNKNLRQNSAALEAANKQIESFQEERRAFEKHEKEVKRLRQELSDRAYEIKQLHDLHSKTKKELAAEEDKKRVMMRTITRLEDERDKAASNAEKYQKLYDTMRVKGEEIDRTVKKYKQEIADAKAEKEHAVEDLRLKTQQYDSGEKLLASMRHQIAELETRLREAETKSQGSEEELTQLQEHLRGREGEAESLRRRMEGIKNDADARVEDMKSQMEIAIKERDSIEEQSMSDARNHSREVENYKRQIKDKDSRLNPLKEEFAQLEARYQELRKLQQRHDEVGTSYEMTISELRSTLDESEKQVRETEKQVVHLKKLLETTQAQQEKAKRELKTLQSQPKSGAAPGGSDMFNNVERQYIKNILLQLVQAKEPNKRLAIVPAFTQVLPFNKYESSPLPIQYLALSTPQPTTNTFRDETTLFKTAVEHIAIRRG